MRRGITLLEVLVAAGLLAVGVVAGLAVIGNSAATTQRVEDRTRALLFARSKLDEVLKQPVLQVGTDTGKGVDQTTDYDWEAVVEESQNPLLMSVVVRAQNRVTGLSVSLSALRRPDLQDPQPATDGATSSSAGGTQ